MAEKLDPNEIVTLEELALSSMREMTQKNRVRKNRVRHEY